METNAGKAETAWILRSPCGCTHGATLIDMGIRGAWKELAGKRATACAKAGWTLTSEPADMVIEEVRAGLGHCRHREGTIKRETPGG